MDPVLYKKAYFSCLKVCNTIYMFDTNTLKWTKFKNVLTDAAALAAGLKPGHDEDPPDDHAVTGQIPMARDGHSACVIDDDMYIYGGYVERAHQVKLTSLAI